MAQRLSIRNTPERCATDTGVPHPPEAASLPQRSTHASFPRSSASSSTLIISRSISACESCGRIGRRAPRLCFANEDLCAPTSGTAPFSTCHGDMTHP
ncbi:hypothetical protein LDENG_00271870 [Lucifuga dentata]|nr:hypothetical protein LDENG_00271870 [Lucifuga dentata]